MPPTVANVEVVILGMHDSRVHRTVGQLGQDTRRNPGDRAHATVHELAASTRAAGSDAQGPATAACAAETRQTTPKWKEFEQIAVP